MSWAVQKMKWNEVVTDGELYCEMKKPVAGGSHGWVWQQKHKHKLNIYEKAMKAKIFSMNVRPVVTYQREAWSMKAERNEKRNLCN